MQISKENVDDLNAIIKVKVEKDDYEEHVNQKLSDYRKKANMPGFRPGKVPMGMIKKMYEKPVLVEEINKTVSQSLTQYIMEQQLHVLGEPLPNEELQEPVDWENQEEFEFSFDVGLAPEFELELSEKDKLPYYELEPDKEFLDNQIKQYQRQHGHFHNTDTAGEQSMLAGDFVELDENGEPKSDGIITEGAKISVELIKDEAIKNQLTGAGAGEVVTMNVKKAYPNAAEISSMLNISKERAESLDADFRFTVKEISEFHEAELNQELFDKVYGEGSVTSEKEFREKVKEDLKQNLVNDSEYKFHQDAKELLIKKAGIAIPEEFLKRWIKATNEDNQEVTDEKIENDFPQFEEDVKWQLIKSKIVKENNIEVSEEELKAYTRELARMQFLQYGLADFNDEHLDNYANTVLEKEEERSRLKDKKQEEKVIDFIKKQVKINTKKVDTKAFESLLENTKNKK